MTWIKQQLEHKRREKRDPTDEETSETIMLLRSYYLGAFGLREFKRAVPNYTDQENVIEFMRQNGLNFSEDGLPPGFTIKRKTRPRFVDSPIPVSGERGNNTA